MVAYDTGCIRAMGWFTGMCHGVARLDRGDRIDMWGRATGKQVTGWIGAMGLNHGICDNGWIGAMELFYGDMRHWLEQGNGVDLWRCGALAGTGWWDWFRGLAIGAHDTGWIRVMGLIYGGVPWGMQHGLDRGDGIDLWDTSWGHTTGSGRWDWFEGAILAGCELWDWFIGVFHGGRNWIGAMELICGGEPWGRMTLARSGWGDWFMWARHEGVRHWLDWGYGIDPWARVEWQSTIWLLNVNDDTMCLMCLMSGVEVSVQSVFG